MHINCVVVTKPFYSIHDIRQYIGNGVLKLWCTPAIRYTHPRVAKVISCCFNFCNNHINVCDGYALRCLSETTCQGSLLQGTCANCSIGLTLFKSILYFAKLLLRIVKYFSGCFSAHLHLCNLVRIMDRKVNDLIPCRIQFVNRIIEALGIPIGSHTRLCDFKPIGPNEDGEPWVVGVGV